MENLTQKEFLELQEKHQEDFKKHARVFANIEKYRREQPFTPLNFRQRFIEQNGFIDGMKTLSATSYLLGGANG